MIKKKSLSYYKKKLDAIFSKYIRARDKYICYTCNRQCDKWSSQNGHFVPRQYLKTRWDERNNHCQCYACNMLHNGQPSRYAQRLREDFGDGIIDELEANRGIPIKLEVEWYLDKIKYYEEEFKKIEN